MTPIRIGILGLAHGHIGMYCAQWKQMPGVQVVAAYDHDVSRRSASCAQLGLAFCESAEALCARTDVDAVVIGAETSLHADMVEIAASAKKQIVLQKPFALSLEDADRIVRAVQQSDVPFTIAWQMRVDPQNRKMRELVQSGVLGKILMVRRRHCLSTHTWPGCENT
jgi:predicted dehydrogenase